MLSSKLELTDTRGLDGPRKRAAHADLGPMGHNDGFLSNNTKSAAADVSFSSNTLCDTILITPICAPVPRRGKASASAASFWCRQTSKRALSISSGHLRCSGKLQP